MMYLHRSLLFFTVSISSLFAMADSQRDPEALFESYCFSCHGTGWEDAPVLGDSFAWEPRAEKGLEVLQKNTLNGINSMPAKGTCTDCSEEELATLVQWILEQSI